MQRVSPARDPVDRPGPALTNPHGRVYSTRAFSGISHLEYLTAGQISFKLIIEYIDYAV